MSVFIRVLARREAIKAVKRDLQARGLKQARMALRVIHEAADEYLHSHPELIEQAKETVRNVATFRTLYEQEQRKLRRIRR